MVSSLQLKVAAAWVVVTAFVLSGCGEFPKRDWGPARSMNSSNLPDPTPRFEPRSRHGNKDYQVGGISYNVLEDADGYIERGLASWYGQKFHGRATSSGEVYDMYGMTAAHRTLPLPSYVRVTHLQNGRSCIVRVNDRGPFRSKRVIDLSYAAASKLGIVESGTAMVEVSVIGATSTQEDSEESGTMVMARPGFDDAPIPNQIDPSVPAIRRAPHDRIYVQVGAFASRQNAERLRNRLFKERKITAVIQSSRHDGKTLYQLRVGPTRSEQESEQLVSRLKGFGIGTPHLVRETPAAKITPHL